MIEIKNMKCVVLYSLMTSIANDEIVIKLMKDQKKCTQ